jgi:tetratricopeptide (TPR) repeat protein
MGQVPRLATGEGPQITIWANGKLFVKSHVVDEDEVVDDNLGGYLVRVSFKSTAYLQIKGDEKNDKRATLSANFELHLVDQARPKAAPVLKLTFHELRLLRSKSEPNVWFITKDGIEIVETALYYARARAWYAKKEYYKAIDDYTHAIRLVPEQAALYNERGQARIDTKDYGRAVEDYTEAVRLNPLSIQATSSLGWLLATCPEEKFRDGAKALTFAKRLAELDKAGARTLEVLAAAHAEKGEFDEAARWQERALEDAQLKDDASARARLELYRKKEPYRQEP